MLESVAVVDNNGVRSADIFNVAKVATYRYTPWLIRTSHVDTHCNICLADYRRAGNRG